MTGPAVELRGVGRSYGDRVALSGVTVSLPAGSTLAVFGANGAGKTTLLRVLATLLRPHEGEVTVLGASLPGDAWSLRGRLGYVAHEPLLYPRLTARENLALHARLQGVPAGRVEEVLEAVSLTRRADEPLRELSRGMVQRAAVARAVLHEPPLLLLDEPRAGLDPAAWERLDPLIGRGSGRARVLVTHDVEHGLAEADLALGLARGRQALSAAASETDPGAIRELYR